MTEPEERIKPEEVLPLFAGLELGGSDKTVAVIEKIPEPLTEFEWTTFREWIIDNQERLLGLFLDQVFHKAQASRRNHRREGTTRLNVRVFNELNVKEAAALEGIFFRER